MKTLLIFLGALAAYGQTISLSDTLTNAVGGGSFTGRITVTLSAPGSAQPLYYSTTSLTGWQAVYCLGVTGSDCTTTTAAGVFAATLYANSTITPAGTSYSARFTPAKGSPWSEVWVITPSTTTLRQIRATTVPTPTTTFQASQLALASGSMVYGSTTGVGAALGIGSTGQVLGVSAGLPAWVAAPACSTCVTTSGSYADPAWITSLAGAKISGAVPSASAATALAANGTNCSAGSFPLGVDSSGNSETCTALPTTITGTANQITVSAPTGGVTLSLPATITGLTSVTSTGFTGALTGNASTATALSSTVASGLIWFGQGTGIPASSGKLTYTDASALLWVGSAAGAGEIRSDQGSGLNWVSLKTTTPKSGLFRSGQDFFVYYDTANGSTVLDNTFGGSSVVSLRYQATEALRIPSTRNIIIGTTTDRNYKFLVNTSGSTGTVSFVDTTLTTGFTLGDFGWDGTNRSATYSKFRIWAGASQGGSRLLELYDSSGAIEQGWAVGAAYIQYVGGNIASNQAAGSYNVSNDKYFGWSSAANLGGGNLIDTALRRNAAGVVEINNGTAGILRDLLARQYKNTPVAVASLQTCNAGNAGTLASVSDALAPAWGVAIASGGAAFASVVCNGTNWTVTGK